MNAQQRYLFDVEGYFVVKNALTPSQVAAANSVLDSPPASKRGHHQGGALHWDPVFREMMDNPQISPILEDLIGSHTWGNYYGQGQEALPSFRLDHLNVHLHVKQGHKAEGLHGGNFGSHAGGSQFFRYHDGKFYNGLLVVAYELQDTVANNGGFGCIPGSHKGNLDLPAEWSDPNRGGPPNLRRVPAEAGDAIVFTEALTHCTLDWPTPGFRRTLFYKYSPHGVSWAAEFFDPAEFDDYADVTDRMRAILEPPNARHPGRSTTPRFQSEARL